MSTTPLVWPFFPNWDQLVSERLQWLTDILVSPQGGEQRRSLRISPRRSFEAEVIAAHQERAMFDLAVAQRGGLVWSLPIWPDGQLLDADLSADDLVVPCRTEGFDFVAGGQAVLRGETAFDIELVHVESVSPGGLVLAQPLAGDWPAGTALYPARLARLAEQPSVTRMTDELLKASVSFDLAEPSDWPESLPDQLYRGRPVFLARPEESNELKHGTERLLQVLDNSISLPAVTDTAGRGFVLLNYRWLLAGRQQHTEWRSLAYALRGRAGSVWVSTHAADLVVMAKGTASTLAVRRCGYARLGLMTMGKQDLHIQLHDGTELLRRVVNVSQAGDMEYLALDTPLPKVYAPEEVARISYLALCRLTDDQLELKHQTDADGLASVEVTWRGVRDDLESMA